jgi:hypothetical protein
MSWWGLNALVEDGDDDAGGGVGDGGSLLASGQRVAAMLNLSACPTTFIHTRSYDPTSPTLGPLLDSCRIYFTLLISDAFRSLSLGSFISPMVERLSQLEDVLGPPTSDNEGDARLVFKSRLLVIANKGLAIGAPSAESANGEGVIKWVGEVRKFNEQFEGWFSMSICFS